MDELILVNTQDHAIGHGDKLSVHRAGQLHRAFSVFIIHDGKMLLQQRNIHKYHSGGLWTNACCSHPRFGEDLNTAVVRRMREELGAECPCQELFHFIYRAVFPNGITEYEYDHVFLADYNGSFSPDPEEIAELKWVDIEQLRDDMVKCPEKFTPWFLISAARVLELAESRGG